MSRVIHIGNVRVLDTTDPFHKEGIILKKDVEFYYTRFKKIVCLNNGIYMNNKREAIEDYDYLTQTNQSTENLLYMEDISSYKVSDKDFKNKIKTMKKNRNK